MIAKRLACAVGVLMLAACGAQAASVDLSPSGAFDPVRDRPRVTHCMMAYYGFASLGVETIGVDQQAVMKADEKVFGRVNRLTPFVAAVERRAGLQSGGLTSEAVTLGAAYERRFKTAALVPGQKDRLFREAIAETERCDALVRSWGAAPAN